MSERTMMHNISTGNYFHSYIIICIYMHIYLEVTMLYINSANIKISKARPYLKEIFIWEAEQKL